MRLLLSALKTRNGCYFWVSPDLVQARVAQQFLCRALNDCILAGHCQHIKQEKTFVLPNGSRIEIRTAESPRNIRGQGLDGVVIDEAAFIHEDVYYEAVKPALADKQGWTAIASTPNGFNWLYQFYQSIKHDVEWFILECPTSSSPLITSRYLEQERVLMGENRFAQEYGGKFVASGDALFDPSWFDDVLVDRIPDGSYNRSVVSVDLSLGYQHSDWQVVLFLGLLDNTFYVDCNVERMPIPALVSQIVEMHQRYKAEGIVVESNGFQALVAHDLERRFEVVPPIWEQVNTVKKDVRIARLATILSRHQVKVLNTKGGRELVHQLRDWPSKEAHDDGPDALESAWRSLCET